MRWGWGRIRGDGSGIFQKRVAFNRFFRFICIMKKRDTESLLPDYFYHVFARTNNKETLFSSDENYRFFLRRYSDFLLPIAKTYTYALLENHVHFLIKMRNEQTLTTFCETINLVRKKAILFWKVMILIPQSNLRR